MSRGDLACVEGIEPLSHGWSNPDRRKCCCVLKPDKVNRSMTDYGFDFGDCEQSFGPDEIGHAARPCLGGPAPQPFNGMEPWRSACLDENNQSQAPDRKGPHFIRFHRAADETTRFGRHRKPRSLYPLDERIAVLLPFAQWITTSEQWVLDCCRMRVSAVVSGRCVISDQTHNLLASCPRGLGRAPRFEEGILRSNLPF